MGDQIIYLIDTDVLVAIRNKKDSSEIYSALIQKAADGDLKTVRQVFTELETFGAYFDFLLKERAKFVVPAEQQFCQQVQDKLDVLGNKGWIWEQTGNKDPADPWLIATASAHKYVLVTNEKQNSPKSIPAACKIPETWCRCISGPHFLYEVGIVKSIKPEHISVDAFFQRDT